MKGERRHRVGSPGQRAKEAGEDEWETPGHVKNPPRALMIAFGAIALAVLGPLVWVLAGGGIESKSAERTGGTDETRDEVESAESVATAFLAVTNPEHRLGLVQNPDEIRDRLAEYSPAARSEPGKIDKLIGHSGNTTAFAVTMASREKRLLEVVATAEGPKVDWDAYARYGTATWEELWSGEVQQAIVRVFCEPSSEAPTPFADREQWTALRMTSPDLPQVALGFAEVGTVREAMMKKVVLGSPRYRQRFVLEVLRHGGKYEPLFEITRCLAVGWILAEQAVEEEWANDGVENKVEE